VVENWKNDDVDQKSPKKKAKGSKGGWKKRKLELIERANPVGRVNRRRQAQQQQQGVVFFRRACALRRAFQAAAVKGSKK
jgi:hypothetical protein